MNKFSKLVAFMLGAALAFAMASCSNSAGNGDTPTVKPPTVTYIGAKAPSEAKAVGDIVFSDGSATPYRADLQLTDAQKAKAIALIFYKGTGLNSGDDTTTSRTLGVGLKHSSSGLAWCIGSANAYSMNITTIQCTPKGKPGALTFTGDKDGSDNLSQIGTFLASNSSADDTATAANYPAFYFAKNYKNTATNIAGTDYEDGWYLPSNAELFQIYACRADAENGFDIDAASALCGGSSFGSSTYWQSSQFYSGPNYVNILKFNNGDWFVYGKHDECSVCAVRAFD